MAAHLCVIHHDEDRSGVPAGPTTILLNHVFLFLFIVVSCCPLSMATELCTNPELGPRRALLMSRAGALLSVLGAFFLHCNFGHYLFRPFLGPPLRSPVFGHLLAGSGGTYAMVSDEWIL